MLVKTTSLVLCIWMSLLLAPGSGEIFEECEGVDDEVFVASLNSCSSYILCRGDDSMIGDCDEGQYFDGESGMCDDKENVYCALDEVDNEGEEEDEDEDEEEDEDEDASEAEIEATTVATTTQATTTLMTTVSSAAIVSTIRPENGLMLETEVWESCPQVENSSMIVVLPNKNSCSDYYLCYHGKPVEMHCTNQLLFNAKTGKCDFPENVQCEPLRPTPSKCLPHMTELFPHPDNCNYFYYCVKGYMTIQQCPFYYGWDTQKRSCVLMSEANCYAGARRRAVKRYLF